MSVNYIYLNMCNRMNLLGNRHFVKLTEQYFKQGTCTYYTLSSQEHNLYRLNYISLEEVNVCLFKNNFKVRLQKVINLVFV